MLDEKEREFAKACLESGITDLDSSANIERSKLIAKQKKLNNYENVEELQQLINTFIEEKNEKEREKNKKKVEKKKAEEKEKKKLLEKYENASGRDKTIRYLDDLIEEAQFIIDERDEAVKSADDIKKVYAALGKSVEPVKSPPKQDWAIAGGIASAIAGPAAGIAIASDIQRKNAESRIDPEEAAQEAQRFKDSLKETGDSLAEKIIENSGISAGDYRTAKGRKADLLKQKEKCEVLLVDDTVDQYQLLSILVFFGLKKVTGNTSLAVMGMMIIMLPLFFLAMYERDGQPLEVIAKHFVESKFIRPKVRPYQTDNYYSILMRQAQAERELPV